MKTTRFIKRSTILSGFILCLASPMLAAETGAPHWSYEGEEGPDHWDGLGIAIISTSKGFMTDVAARSGGYGGEIICYVA